LDTIINDISYNYNEYDSVKCIQGYFNKDKNKKLNGPYIGIKEETFMDSVMTIYIHGYFKNSKETGIWKTKDGEGQIINRGLMVRGKPRGNWCMFYGLSIYRYNYFGKLKAKMKTHDLVCPG
jgi:hypothetical protein